MNTKENLLIDEVQENITNEIKNELKKEEWKDIGMPKTRFKGASREFSDQDLEYIYKSWFVDKIFQVEIAKKFGVADTSIYNILRGKFYTHRLDLLEYYKNLGKESEKERNKDLKGEIWIDVENFEGSYKVSNLGRIKSLERKDRYDRHIPEKILDCKPNGEGLSIRLQKHGKKWNIQVHKLVAIHFIPNPANLPEIFHINKNKLDNRVENIMWVDSGYKTRKLIENGGLDSNKQIKNYQLKPENVINAFIDFYKNSKTIEQVAKY